ncbi:DUF6993 domain-containing protein [Cellulosimicrobium cellulans]|uniref:DUF6993 domain-containing protein n=1 Tax=Cellulosimicrobium cellulans TaxID=1710 RepID=UPI0008484A82|nr:hypothetical protein [Cellulosimicrobium cellulans]
MDGETSSVPGRVARVVAWTLGLGVAALLGWFVLLVVGVGAWSDAYDDATAPGPAVSPSATVTGACPETGTDDAGGGDPASGTTCAPYDGEAAMRANEAYRQRAGTPEGDALAAQSVPAVESALVPLVTGEPLDRDEVVAALRAAGFTDAAVTPETSPLGLVATSFGVGVSVPGGCVFGGVAPDGVTLEAGGPIADGGCLAMPAH